MQSTLLALAVFTIATGLAAAAEHASTQSPTGDDPMAHTTDASRLDSMVRRHKTRSEKQAEAIGVGVLGHIAHVDANGESSVHSSSGCFGISSPCESSQGSRRDETRISFDVVQPTTPQDTMSQLGQSNMQLVRRHKSLEKIVADFPVAKRVTEKIVQVDVDHAGAINLRKIGVESADDAPRAQDNDANVNTGADDEKNVISTGTYIQALLIRNRVHARLSATSVAHLLMVDLRDRLGAWFRNIIFCALVVLAIALGWFVAEYVYRDLNLSRRFYTISDQSADSPSSTLAAQKRTQERSSFQAEGDKHLVVPRANEGIEVDSSDSDFAQASQPTVLVSHPSKFQDTSERLEFTPA